jgi:hypothetical protein
VTRPYRFAAVLATVALAAGASTAFAHDDDHGGRGDDHGRHRGDAVLRSELFGSMPDGPVLFGVKPGGAPWAITRGAAKVRADGRVKVRVRGLVIPTAPQNGTNPLSGIAATVFCGGTAVGTTASAPFSTAGDARIDATLATPLPRPCLAPAVLLNPAPGGVVNTTAYIAASGA